MASNDLQKGLYLGHLDAVLGAGNWRAWYDFRNLGTWVQVGDNPEARRFFDEVDYYEEGFTPVLDWAKEVKERGQ